MTLHELVVVTPFANYQRGNLINDAQVVSKILDKEDEMHAYLSNVRKTSKIIEPKIEIISAEVSITPEEKPIPEQPKSTISKLEKKQ
jgi:hypothetical protein